MAKRPKYHFLVLKDDPRTGRMLLTLPGQTFGLNPVPPGRIVGDAPKRTVLARARKKGSDGDVYFTETLRLRGIQLEALDAQRLDGELDLMHSDAPELYKLYLEGREGKP